MGIHDLEDLGLNKDVCTEVWGDGLDFGENEWEDGNLVNGDGWDSLWEMEHWFECKGGNKTSVDKWSLLYITSNLTKTSIPNTYDVAFSTEMKQIDINLNDFLLSVDSKYNIQISWDAIYINNKTLRVSIKTNSVLVGDEAVSLKFINYCSFLYSQPPLWEGGYRKLKLSCTPLPSKKLYILSKYLLKIIKN